MKNSIRNFYDLDAWKKGHLLVLEIYRITDSFPKNETYGVVSQLRRASSSITANIAEGFARYHFKEKIKFYYNSRGSVAEVQNFLLLAKVTNELITSSKLTTITDPIKAAITPLSVGGILRAKATNITATNVHSITSLYSEIHVNQFGDLNLKFVNFLNLIFKLSGNYTLLTL